MRRIKYPMPIVINLIGREREPGVSLVRREREIMTKKYELTQNTFTVAMEDLYQIKALQDFGDVKETLVAI